MVIRIGRREATFGIGCITLVWPLVTGAAVAPEYRWESVAPMIVLVSPVGGRVALKSVAIELDCGHDCIVTSSYLLVSEQAQSVGVTAISGQPSSLRIRSRESQATMSPVRATGQADLDRIGAPRLVAPGDLSTVAVTLVLAAGINEITIFEHVPLATRGRGTNAAVRAVEIVAAPLRDWNVSPGFTLATKLSYGSELIADLRAAGLEDGVISPLCVRYGGGRDPSIASLDEVKSAHGLGYFTASFDHDFPTILSFQVGNAVGARYWN